MKSYFAKLAARATLANAPVPKPVNAPSTPNPFETTVTSSEPTPRAAVSPPTRSSHEAPAKRGDLSKTQSRTVELQPPTEPIVTQAHKSPTTGKAVVTEDQQSTTEATLISELRPSRRNSETRSSERVESQDLNVTPTTKPDRLSPETQRSTQAPSTSTKREKSQSADADNVDERLSNIENEQAILLRKADAFMAGLFEHPHRSSNEPRGEEREDEGQQRAVKKVESLIQPPTRLQPPPPRASEPVGEEPSLVIGKLSVEVVQTPPPAVTPQRQVVVIGGGRRARAGIPSAHRFGFSRY